ncbi:MAG: hypothetical protein ACKVOX_00805 [Rhizobacter sp.]
MAHMKPLDLDTREAQAARAADFMELHPDGVTLAEINAAADLGSPTKVHSDMRGKQGYGIRRGNDRAVRCAGGTTARRVRTFVLTHRPAKPHQLSLTLE